MASATSHDETLSDVVKRIGYMFYVVDPKESTFEKVQDVPNYIDLAIPVFIAFWIIEMAIKIFRARNDTSKTDMHFADSATSVYAGLLQETFRFATRGFTTSIYVWAYNRYRLVDMPVDSVFTWIIGAVSLDFFYYWFHRANHEINILWAAHQVHHSSEEYNLSTALRQSITQNIPIILVYFPMIFYLPPTHYVVHYQLNLLYQFWIHTEEVESLGFLEHVLMTPSHHRVHHGANRYCIDKNYGACLIIWDKLFGTFEPENDRVVYGLTHPVASFNPWVVQGKHYVHIWEKVKGMPTVKDKMWAVLKGPGWHPGTARLGDPNELPDHKYPMKKYNKPISPLAVLYMVPQLVITVLNLRLYYEAVQNGADLQTELVMIVHLGWAATNCGLIFENDPRAAVSESFRCFLAALFFPTLFGTGLPHSATSALKPYLLVSAFGWLVRTATTDIVRHPSSKGKNKGH